MNFSYIQKKKLHNGFSLIELLVSLSIFSIIMVASTGTLLTLIDVNAKAQALYTATNNLSFALDSITREMRMGYHYYCFPSDNTDGQSLPDQTPPHPVSNDDIGCDAVAFFRERDDAHIAYRLFTDIDDNIGVIQQYDDSGNWLPMTSPSEVMITQFEFDIDNSVPYCANINCTTNTSDEDQPTVVLRIAGYVNNGLDTNTDFNIQTRILQRKLDIY